MAHSYRLGHKDYGIFFEVCLATTAGLLCRLIAAMSGDFVAHVYYAMGRRHDRNISAGDNTEARRLPYCR